MGNHLQQAADLEYIATLFKENGRYAQAAKAGAASLRGEPTTKLTWLCGLLKKLGF